MTAFHLFAINAAVSLYGTFLFLWWWYKTSKATKIYILVTILFFAEAVEKSVFVWLRYHFQYGDAAGIETHRQIVSHPYWWTVAIPTTLAFLAIVIVMTNRIYRSHKAMKRVASVTSPPRISSNHILLISNRRQTRRFMRNVFATAQIQFSQVESFIGGLEMLVADPSISVVVVGLSAIEDSGLSQSTVVRMIKKERPWCFVVALSRQPNLYELVEARRSFFDDYLYLPIRPSLLLDHFKHWKSRTLRWRRLDYSDRRKKNGTVKERQGIRVRKNPDNPASLDESRSVNKNF